mmetsp:Transcript_25329/g.54493  ORF Transcript_25329/g.54493 Transcript_25329/m.54493 type:complete len:379 (-) Transcript_25329:188-1324(-)
MRRELILLLSTIRRVHIFKEMGLHRRFSRGLGLLDLFRHILSDALLRFLNLFGIGKSSINDSLLHELKRITSGSSQCNLLTVTVGGTRVRHGMPVVTVCHHLHIHGTIARTTPLLHKSHTLLDSQDIHAINPHSRNMIPHLVIIRMRRVTIHTRSHTIVIILNTENHGQVPQTGHVGTLPNLSLVGCPVSVARNGHLHGLTGSGIVMVGKCESRPDRNLRPHNTLSSEKVVFLVVKVHGTTLAHSLPINVPEQLAQNAGDSSSSCQCGTMATITRNPRIFRFERRVDTRGDRLLSIVQVAKSANGTRLVFVIARDFHTAHGVHQLKVAEELFLGHFDGVVWCGVELVGFEGAGEVEGGDVGGGGHETREVVVVGDAIA